MACFNIKIAYDINWHHRQLTIPDKLLSFTKKIILLFESFANEKNIIITFNETLLNKEFPDETINVNFDKERFVDLWIKELGRMTPEQRAIWDEYYQDISDEYHAVKDDAKALALWQYQRYMHDYMGSIKSLDENIGRVLDYLQAQGLSDNTIVVYTSDQGFYLGEHGWYDKRFMYEESMSTPLIIKYPNGVKAGVVNTSLVQNLDFAQTFLDYAGLVAPSDMQGKSLKPLLEGNTPDDWRDGLYYEYFQYPGTHNVGLHYGMRTDRYKLIHFTGDLESWELFDLEKDPSEMSNVYANVQYKDIQADLHKRLEDLRLQYKAN